MIEEDEIVFDIEYLYSQLDLLGKEEEGLSYWLALMDIYQEAGRFNECQQLLRFIKSVRLSPGAIAQVHHAAGDLYRQQGRWEEVNVAYKRALSIYHEIDQPASQAGVLNDYALALQEQRRYQEADDCYHDALVLYESQGDSASQGHVYANLGSMAYEKGHWRETAK